MDVLVIGGGAAGMMAAGVAASRGKSVVLLERNEKPGRKIAITGKGRCNVTNDCPLVGDFITHVPRNGRFLYSALSSFGTEDTKAFFAEQGVPLKVERGNRVFPVSDKAFDIVDALHRFAVRSGAVEKHGRAASLTFRDGAVTGCVTEEGETLTADSVIVATGGLSYPVTGSTGDGYGFAREAGHTIVTPVPSLVALTCHEGWCTDAQGLSLKNAAIRVEDTEKNRCVYEDFGEMLFTHFGVSGPMILSASAHLRDMHRGRYRLLIDLKPALDTEQLDRRLTRDLTECANKNLYNCLSLSLPRKLVPVVAKLSKVNGTVKCNQVTAENRAAIVGVMKRLCLEITGFRPIEEAVITSGGVAVNEVNPKTMESRLVKGLYFAGEVLDTDAYTGGFNLQIAFSTGHLAGESV